MNEGRIDCKRNFSKNQSKFRFKNKRKRSKFRFKNRKKYKIKLWKRLSSAFSSVTRSAYRKVYYEVTRMKNTLQEKLQCRYFMKTPHLGSIDSNQNNRSDFLNKPYNRKLIITSKEKNTMFKPKSCIPCIPCHNHDKRNILTNISFKFKNISFKSFFKCLTFPFRRAYHYFVDTAIFQYPLAAEQAEKTVSSLQLSTSAKDPVIPLPPQSSNPIISTSNKKEGFEQMINYKQQNSSTPKKTNPVLQNKLIQLAELGHAREISDLLRKEKEIDINHLDSNGESIFFRAFAGNGPYCEGIHFSTFSTLISHREAKIGMHTKDRNGKSLLAVILESSSNHREEHAFAVILHEAKKNNNGQQSVFYLSTENKRKLLSMVMQFNRYNNRASDIVISAIIKSCQNVSEPELFETVTSVLHSMSYSSWMIESGQLSFAINSIVTKYFPNYKYEGTIHFYKDSSYQEFQNSLHENPSLQLLKLKEDIVSDVSALDTSLGVKCSFHQHLPLPVKGITATITIHPSFHNT